MELNQQFAELIESLGATLKTNGFKRQGNYFYKQENGNWSVIQLQKSINSTADEIKFTVNIGVSSETIRQFGIENPLKKKPIIDECQWNLRLGELLPNKEDKWWVINNITPIEPLMKELQSHLVKIALPEMKKHVSDEHLLSLWISGKSPGITEIKRLINICILLKKFRKQDELIKTLVYLEQLSEGKAYAPMVQHVKMQLLD